MKDYKFRVSILRPFNYEYAFIYLDNVDVNLSGKELEDLAKDKFIKQFGKYNREELSVAWC